MENFASDSLSNAARAMGPLSGLVTQPLAMALRVQTNAMRQAMDMQIEAFDFMKHRYEQDVRFIEAVRKSRTPSDAVSCYAGFLQATIDDYSRETAKVMKLGSKEGEQAVADTRDTVQENVERFEQVQESVSHQADPDQH